jgi:hypothetical protein
MRSRAVISLRIFLLISCAITDLKHIKILALRVPVNLTLMAVRDEKHFLIEAKWKKSKMGSTEIDDLRVRLKRTPQTVIGCIFSMSAFRSEAITEIKSDRSKEILVFSADELWGIV